MSQHKGRGEKDEEERKKGDGRRGVERREEERTKERREEEKEEKKRGMTTFCVVVADLSPSGGFQKVFGDQGKHNAGKNEDNNEHHTHQDRIPTHCCFNDPITIHVCVWVCM